MTPHRENYIGADAIEIILDAHAKLVQQEMELAFPRGKQRLFAKLAEWRTEPSEN